MDSESRVRVIALWIVLAHLVGDYLIQSDWMASEKTKRWWPAIAHGATYTLPYALITQSPWALVVIASTHVVIDHYRLARHVCWLKNQLAPRRFRSTWQDSKATGYPSDKPIWMAVWLMIIADNTMHLLINAFAVVCL
jgi:hypothetical protein